MDTGHIRSSHQSMQNVHAKISEKMFHPFTINVSLNAIHLILFCYYIDMYEKCPYTNYMLK